MSDEDDDAIVAVVLECFVNQSLAFDIDLAGRFIKDQHVGVAKKRSGQGNSLSLPSAQAMPVAANDRVVTVRSGHDKFVSTCQFRSLENLFVAVVPTAVANVVHHRFIEQF